MNSPNNIYDIDGKLLYDAENPQELTVDEAKKRIEYYQNKLENEEEGSHKYNVYTSYIVNLQRFAFNEYINHPEKYNNLTNATNTDEIQKALKELAEENDGITEGNIADEIQRKLSGDSEGNADKEPGNDVSVERTDSNIQEIGSDTQGSVLDEPAIMDEYVDFEEVKDENNIQ